jgi:hypothetical protein
MAPNCPPTEAHQLKHLNSTDLWKSDPVNPFQPAVPVCIALSRSALTRHANLNTMDSKLMRRFRPQTPRILSSYLLIKALDNASLPLISSNRQQSVAKPSLFTCPPDYRPLPKKQGDVLRFLRVRRWEYRR